MIKLIRFTKLCLILSMIFIIDKLMSDGFILSEVILIAIDISGIVLSDILENILN